MRSFLLRKLGLALTARPGWPVDDEQVEAFSGGQCLGCGGEGLDRNHRLNPLGKPQTVPIDRGTLLGVKIGHLDTQASGSGLTGKCPGQGGFTDATLLGDKRDNCRHRPHSYLSGRWPNYKIAAR